MSKVQPLDFGSLGKEKSYTEMYLGALKEAQMTPELDINFTPDEADDKALSRFRVASYAAMASLPSAALQNSQVGHALGRQMQRDQRRRGTITSDNSTTPRRRNTRRGTINLEMLDQAAEKGLKMEYDDDDDYDAVERLKQLQVIKQMPIHMYLKRKLRNRLFERMPDLSGGSCEACVYKCKLDAYRCNVRTAFCWMEFLETMTLWRGAFKTIEGHFGSGVVTYFRFLKWLFQVNVVILMLVFFFITLPEVIFSTDGYSYAVTGSTNLTDAEMLASNCSANYVVNTSSDAVQLILDFLQGTGWMEKTAVFYGYYSDMEMVAFLGWKYNMPLAYLIVCAVYFVVSLILMVRHTAKGFREKLFANEDSLKQYCNHVFAGWDYAMDDPKNTKLHHKSIYREITGNLEAEREASRRRSRTGKEKCKIYSIRILINTLILALLAGSMYLIFWVTQEMTKVQERDEFVTYSYIVQFLAGFTSSLTITLLNGLMPVIFKRLVIFEDYTPGFTLNITLARTVFLRLASVGVLIFTLYSEITCTPQDECGVGISPACTSIQCWETLVGQELYKLVIMDLITVLAVTFFVEFPRKLIVSKCDCKLSKIIGHQQFDITKNVLDLVYAEVLLWLGTFFSPMIPAICFVKFIIVFYVKELTLLVNYAPTATTISRSETEGFLSIVLLSAFVLCSVPLLFVIFRMTPSRSCGPFRLYDNMYDILPITVNAWPEWIQSITEWIGSAMFLIPLFVALCLTIYYLDQVWRAYKAMTIVLKDQLHMEGRDKQFLLARIQELSGQKKKPTDSKPSLLSKPPSSIQEESDVIPGTPNGLDPYNTVSQTHAASPNSVPDVD